MSTKNYTINVDGIDCKVKVNAGRYGIYTPVSQTARVIRQLLKQKMKQGWFKKSWVKSESYSMGHNINVNIFGVDETKRDEISSWLKTFQIGSFNGMIDLYEYNDDQMSFPANEDPSVNIELGTKYLFVEFTPPFGTKEYDDINGTDYYGKK